jgi:hypothetical protein
MIVAIIVSALFLWRLPAAASNGQRMPVTGFADGATPTIVAQTRT